MRDFRDAKAMARALRDALKAKAIETTHAETLELIARAFGYENWNILSAKIDAAEPAVGGEGALSVAARNDPPPVFSMAITAWSAKASTSATCLSSNGATLVRASVMPPIG